MFPLWLGKVFDLAKAITNSAASTVAKKKRDLEKQLAAILVAATGCDPQRSPHLDESECLIEDVVLAE